jgi:hypothetical protein
MATMNVSLPDAMKAWAESSDHALEVTLAA